MNLSADLNMPALDPSTLGRDQARASTATSSVTAPRTALVAPAAEPVRDIRSVAVVVPARNEQQRIGAMLEALAAASQALSATHPDMPVRVVVVLDRCTDATADRVAHHPTVETVVSDAGLVGAARAAGITHVLATTTIPPQSIWLACTDADSQVPQHWLRHHLSAAQSGTDLLLGTVRPHLHGPALRTWTDRHTLQDGHPHIHGANLGMTARAYLDAGGFPHVAEHEDLLLVEKIRSMGLSVRSTNTAPVRTSARRTGRTPGGMAGYLRQLPS